MCLHSPSYSYDELAKYDLNGDGNLTGKELTDEALYETTSDTGPAIVAMLVIIITPIYNLFWFSIFALLTFFRYRFKNISGALDLS